MKELLTQVHEAFPNSLGGIIFGSATTSDFIPGISDIDLIIVLEDINNFQTLQQQIKNVQDTHKDKHLDISATTIENLQINSSVVTAYGTRNLHGMDRYRIRIEGVMCWGRHDLIKLIPAISFKDALDDVIPHIRKVFIKGLLEEIQNSKILPSDFLYKKLDIFLVIARTVASFKKGIIVSKIDSLDYLKSNEEDLSNIVNALKGLYLRTIDSPEINKNNIECFLQFAKQELG